MKIWNRKSFTLNLLMFLGLGFVLACNNSVSVRPSPPSPQRIYGSTIEDKIEALPKVQGYDVKPYVESTRLEINSFELLKLSNLLLEAPNKSAQLAGLRISELLSQPGVTASAITAESVPPGNPYAEQVYQFLRPILIEKFQSALKQSREIVTAATQGIKQRQKTETPARNASSYLRGIIDTLTTFNQKILQGKPQETAGGSASGPSGEAALFLKEVSKTIQEKYVRTLRDFLPKMTKGANQSTTLFLRELQSAILTLPGLSEEDKKLCVVQIQEAVYYAGRVENANDSTEGYKLLIDMWFNKAARNLMPQPIAQFLGGFTEKQLIAFMTKNSPITTEEDFIEIQNVVDPTELSNKELLALIANNKPAMEDKDWQLFNTPALGQSIAEFTISDVVLEWMRFMKIEPSSNLFERFQQIAFYWLNLKFRYSFPKKLTQALSKYDSTDIEKMRDQSTTSLVFSLLPIQGAIRYMIIETIEKYPGPYEKPKDAQSGVRNFQSGLNQKILIAVDNALRERIGSLLETVPDILNREVSLQLEKMEPHFNQKAFETFKIYSKLSVDEWFLKGQSGPHVIADKLIAKKISSSIWQVDGDLSYTTSRVMGAALANVYKIIDSADSELALPTQVPLWIFRGLNNMASLSGYKDYNEQLISSFHIPFLKVGDGKKFDINLTSQYDPKDGVFSVPDRIALKNSYEADTKQSLNGAVVSPEGQFELLSSYNLALRYLRPWVSNSFEQRMGSFKIENIDADVFPKTKIFKQALGLALTNLLNISETTLSLVGPGNKLFKEKDNAKGITGAILTTQNQSGVQGQIVRTSEMAKAIESLSEFYELSREFYKFEEPDVQGMLGRIVCDTDDPNGQNWFEKFASFCPSVNKSGARQKVHNLLTGLILFSTSQLMASDGGFYQAVGTKDLSPISKERVLEDQLVMQRALLTAARILKSDVVLFRAVDNYFFLNNFMWSPELGFYKTSETSQDQRLKLKNVLQARMNSLSIKNQLIQFAAQWPKLRASLKQIEDRVGFWDKTVLTSGVLGEHPVVLVQDFRLKQNSKP